MQSLRKRKQGIEPIMVVWCKLKVPSLRITVWHHSASLVMPNSYPHDGIINWHRTNIKDSYNIPIKFNISFYCFQTHAFGTLTFEFADDFTNARNYFTINPTTGVLNTQSSIGFDSATVYTVRNQDIGAIFLWDMLPYSVIRSTTFHTFVYSSVNIIPSVHHLSRNTQFVTI